MRLYFVVVRLDFALLSVSASPIPPNVSLYFAHVPSLLRLCPSLYRPLFHLDFAFVRPYFAHPPSLKIYFAPLSSLLRCCPSLIRPLFRHDFAFVRLYFAHPLSMDLNFAHVPSLLRVCPSMFGHFPVSTSFVPVSTSPIPLA